MRAEWRRSCRHTSLSRRPATFAGHGSACRPLQATAKVIPADYPLARLNRLLLRILGQQELPPQPSPTVQVCRQLLIPGVDRQQRTRLAQCTGPATRPAVRPRIFRQPCRQRIALDVTPATEQISLRLVLLALPRVLLLRLQLGLSCLAVLVQAFL